jgi:predicted permease
MAFASCFRHAFLRLRDAPSFALLCVLTLAVGVGAVVTVFSVVNGVLLDPLPYPDPDRLVGLWHDAPGLNLPPMPQSPATYLLYSRESRALAGVGVYHDLQVNLTGVPSPERLTAAAVTPSLLRLLGVAPALGRGFTEEDGRPGAGRVALLSDRLWRRTFGADPRVLGSTLRLDGVPFEVTGVMRPGFELPRPETDLWLPLVIDPAQAPLGQLGLTGIGRLAPGVSIPRAQADLNRLIADLERRFPGDDAAPVLVHAGFTARVHPLREDLVGDFSRVLWILLGAVGCVLLIACANVANLLIVRGEGRRREVAVHTALGAPRGALVVAVLAESLLLGLAGGALGLLLAFGALHLLTALGPAELPRLANVRLDGRVLAFTVALSLLTSVLFGLLPALRSSRVADLASELKSGGGRSATAGRSRQRARRLLSGFQIALAFILLTGSGLMLRTFLRVVRLDPGFDPRGVLTIELALPATGYPDDASAARFFQSLTDRLQALPGVVAAGAVSDLPLSGTASGTGYEIEDHPQPKGAPPPVLSYEYVSEGYFRALGIPLREGRLLEARDQERRSGAVVVDEALAKRIWPGQSAVGKRLRPAGSGLPPGSWYTVVGVVGDVRNRTLTDDPDTLVYLPMLGKTPGAWTARQMSLAVRTRSRPEAMVGAVRREIAALAPDLPASNVRTLDRLVDRSRARVSFSVVILAIAAAVALVLGAVGIYGFLSYLAGQRTAEIGVRMAIGAGAWDIRWMILRESLAIILPALAVGLAGAFWMTRWLKALLFEVDPLDPLTFGLMSVLLVLVALLASDLPASRASRTDPLEALRRAE